MGRGPSYPYVGLEDAIGLSRKMYDYAKRGSAPTESVITDAWGYSMTSSSGQKVLAALKAFGLVEDAPGANGKAIKLTSRSIRILLDEPDSSERRAEIQKAALAPKWYEYCWKAWGKETPPSMKSNLLIEHGFVDTTVEGFLKDYRKTLAFSGLLSSGDFGKVEESGPESDAMLKIGDYVADDPESVGQPPRIDSQNVFIPPVANLLVQGDAKMQQETVSLAGGLILQVQWPSTISKDVYDDFIYQVEGFKKRIRRAVKDAPAAGPEQEDDVTRP